MVSKLATTTHLHTSVCAFLLDADFEDTDRCSILTTVIDNIMTESKFDLFWTSHLHDGCLMRWPLMVCCALVGLSATDSSLRQVSRHE